MPQTVAFILALGHSGTTLLGHVLGSHPQGLHVGEVATPLNRGLPVRCFFCGDLGCPVWGGAVPVPFLRRCWRGYRASLGGAGRRLLPLLCRAGWAERPQALYERLFGRWPEKRLIVDSSKSVGWARFNAQSGPLRVAHILMLRDLRALAATRIRTHGEAIETATERVLGQLDAFRSFLATLPAGDARTVRYEDLAGDPPATVAALCGWLGLEFAPEMLDYHAVPHHTFGGNPGTNAAVRVSQGRDPAPVLANVGPDNRGHYSADTLQIGIRLDERWRQALGDEQLAGFERVGGALNRELGYRD